MLGVIELELGQRLVLRALETAVESANPVDDPLDLRIEHRQALADRLQPAVDVVAFLRLGLRR